MECRCRSDLVVCCRRQHLLGKQGANKGATTAFLISTPESGVDSIAVTYALLDPVMTVIRPVAAFLTAMMAGFAENLIFWKENNAEMVVDRSCPVDNCCDGVDCSEEDHANHHTLGRKDSMQGYVLDIKRYGEI